MCLARIKCLQLERAELGSLLRLSSFKEIAGHWNGTKYKHWLLCNSDQLGLALTGASCHQPGQSGLPLEIQGSIPSGILLTSISTHCFTPENSSIFWIQHLSPNHSNLSWAFDMRIVGTGSILQGNRAREAWRINRKSGKLLFTSVNSTLRRKILFSDFLSKLEGLLEGPGSWSESAI